jgi:hypothetical protein
VKAITSGTVDLLSNPLRIEATTNAVDIEVVVQNTNGVRVAGRVIPTPEAPLIPSRVSLNIPPGLTRPAIQSTVASDGTFQFAGVSPGVYTLTSDPNGLLFMGSTTANIVVGDQDITNVPLIGLSDAFIPNTIQYANEAAAVLNINTIQSAQIYFNGHRQRYGSLDELIADGFLSPSYARPISGYTISVTSSGSEITGTALPVTAADGRYEFYFSRNGGARALRLTGPPATTPRAVTLNTLEQVSTCGSDAPLCVRIRTVNAQTSTMVSGRISVVAGPGGSSTIPSGVYVGAVTSDGSGALTSVRPDGAFQVVVPPQPAERRVSIHNLPAGYTVRFIQSSGRDLPNGVFTTPAGFIEVTLESRAAPQQ